MLSLLGCASANKAPPPVLATLDKGPAIYIYRPAQFSNVIISPMVLIDGKSRFKIANGQYTFIHLPVGQHSIRLELEAHYQGDFNKSIELMANQAAFFRVDTAMKFVKGEPYQRSFNLVQVEHEQALSELSCCKYSSSALPAKTNKQKDQDEESRFSTDKTADPFSRNKTK